MVVGAEELLHTEAFQSQRGLASTTLDPHWPKNITSTRCESAFGCSRKDKQPCQPLLLYWALISIAVGMQASTSHLLPAARDDAGCCSSLGVALILQQICLIPSHHHRCPLASCSRLNHNIDQMLK